MTTLNQRLEQIIINLKVIAKLEVGQRLLFKTKSVSIRNNYRVITPMIRWVANESRDDVTRGLSELLEDINRLVIDFLNSSELQNPNASEYDRDAALTILMSLNRLKVELPPVIETGNKGLNAAKETYSDDPETSAKIEGTIDNLKLTIRKINISIAEMIKKFNLESKIQGINNNNLLHLTESDDKIKTKGTEQEKPKESEKLREKENDRNKNKKSLGKPPTDNEVNNL